MCSQSSAILSCEGKKKQNTLKGCANFSSTFNYALGLPSLRYKVHLNCSQPSLIKHYCSYNQPCLEKLWEMAKFTVILEFFPLFVDQNSIDSILHACTFVTTNGQTLLAEAGSHYPPKPVRKTRPTHDPKWATPTNPSRSRWHKV